jgi:hypothetical protein
MRKVRIGVSKIPACFMSIVILAGSTPFVMAAEKDQPVMSMLNSGDSAIQALGQTSLSEYWTPEAMQTAQPLMPTQELAVGDGTGFVTGIGSTEEIVIAPSGNRRDLPTESRISHEGEGEEPEEGDGPGGVGEVLEEFEPGPFTYSRYSLHPDRDGIYKKFPYRAMGRLFFTIPGQGNFVCSASSVNSQNRSMIWTSGHCVATPLVGFHENFLFVPAYHDGEIPFGVWEAVAVGTPEGWINFGLFEYDHGAVVLARGGNKNRLIGRAVGYLGFAANFPRQQAWHSFGYPVAPRDLSSTPIGPQFDGQRNQVCTSAWAMNFLITGLPNLDPPTIGVGCDQTGGSSGGPWVLYFGGEPGESNYVNGNISFKLVDPTRPPNSPVNLNLAKRMYGPYFSDAAIHLRDEAQEIPVP